MYLKKVVLFVFAVWFLVPFVLMTDMYPFMRYGMFAERVKTSQTTEMLQLWCTYRGLPACPFEPETIGLTNNHFGYVLRHYFYTNHIKQLFSQIHTLTLKKQTKPVVFWQLKRFTSSPTQTDTHIIAEWNPANH